MADTSIGVYLGIGVSATGDIDKNATKVSSSSEKPTIYQKLADITDFPDLIGDTEDIESTTMSDKQRTYEKGLQGAPTDSFTAQFDKDTYAILQTLSESGNKYYFCLLLEGSGSLFTWQGEVSVGLGGAGVGEIISMPIKTTFSTQVKLEAESYTYTDTSKEISKQS